MWTWTKPKPGPSIDTLTASASSAFDLDARRTEGKSILAEALQSSSGELARLDLRYENASFDGGIKHLRASYQVVDARLQVGFNINGGERQYVEVDLPAATLFDIPLLIFRGLTIRAIAHKAGNADVNLRAYV